MLGDDYGRMDVDGDPEALRCCSVCVVSDSGDVPQRRAFGRSVEADVRRRELAEAVVDPRSPRLAADKNAIWRLNNRPCFVDGIRSQTWVSWGSASPVKAFGIV